MKRITLSLIAFLLFVSSSFAGIQDPHRGHKNSQKHNGTYGQSHSRSNSHSRSHSQSQYHSRSHHNKQ
jgi:hypothetical protein